jgi:hypothetical protein
VEEWCSIGRSLVWRNGVAWGQHLCGGMVKHGVGICVEEWCSMGWALVWRNGVAWDGHLCGGLV